MPKICLIGAGSTTFAKRLLSDILLTPGLQESEIALHDTATQVVTNVITHDIVR